MIAPVTAGRIRGAAGPPARPRICVPSARRFSRMAFQCGHLEAQDVLAECGDADVIELAAGPATARRVRWLRRLMYHDVSRRLAFVNPGLHRVRLARDYDLLVVMCQGYWEFLYLNAIDGWKDRCGQSLCWIDELYAADLPRFKHWLPSLRRFDHVVVGMHGTVGPLSEVLGRRCHYVPGGVDALRFGPSPDVPERPIDVYNVGRKLPALHRALLAWSAARGTFYLHDTLQTGESHAADHREHRDLYAEIAKRSRFFVVAPGKVDRPEDTGGQLEIGFRYYEGLAAGTVMVGLIPDGEPFRAMFDWPDAVVPVSPDGVDVADVLDDLTAGPERVREIARRNARAALLRHDWVYRWKRLLEIAGLPPTRGMQDREVTLRDLAERAQKGC